MIYMHVVIAIVTIITINPHRHHIPASHGNRKCPKACQLSPTQVFHGQKHAFDHAFFMQVIYWVVTVVTLPSDSEDSGKY